MMQILDVQSEQDKERLMCPLCGGTEGSNVKLTNNRIDGIVRTRICFTCHRTYLTTETCDLGYKGRQVNNHDSVERGDSYMPSKPTSLPNVPIPKPAAKRKYTRREAVKTA